MKINLDHRAEQLPQWALRCRSENHHWKRVAEVVNATTRRGVITELVVFRVCKNCKGKRQDTYSLPSFALLKRSYNYQNAYSVKSEPGEERLSKQAATAAFLATELKALLS